MRERTGGLLARPKASDAATQDRARRRLDPTRLRVIDPADVHIIQTPTGRTEQDLARELLATGDYEYVVPDWLVYPAGIEPNDTGYPNQWHLRKIEAPAAWSRTTGSGALTIAFVDTGVDLTHPDLAPLLVPGFNSASYLAQAQGGDVSDVNGHGTSVAGAGAAMGNNGTGCCGVGWSFPIMPVRASNSPSGSAFLSDVLSGVAWASAHGARVVSVSYAGVESPSVESVGASILSSYGSLLFWGAGNSATALNFDYPSVTVVGATTQSDALASDSNFGTAIDVVAPGVSMYLPARGGGWSWNSGTSFSTPVAAGVLTLLWSANPSLTPAQAMEALYQSVDDLGPPGRDTTFGWGRVNAARAVGRVLPPRAMDTDLRPARIVGARLPELRAHYYTAASPTDPVSSWTYEASTTVPMLSFTLPEGATFPGAPSASRVGAVFEGCLEAPNSGAYTFTLLSNDTARLYVDQELVIDNGGVHPACSRAGSIGLFAGPHAIRCEYATGSGPITLVLSVRAPGAAQQTVSDRWLTHAHAP